MRWQDQSESTRLPALSTFLERLSEEDAVRLTRPDNALPRVAISAECFHTILKHLGGGRRISQSSI